MPSSSKKFPTNVKPVPGTIVWVRRRNGSWWPGRIISKRELLASNVMSPRSGTPVKLLGRDDASVDWYNIEKSKRVKAFRCGEFDDCIEKAQAMAGAQSKRREKYARREDAIVDAIELEKEQIEQLKTVPAKKSRLKGKQKSLDGEQQQPKKEKAKSSKKNSQAKAQGGKDREVSDLDEAPALLPRMRGLRDLVSAGTSSKISSVEGSSGASLLDDTQIVPEHGKSMKRKRTVGKPEEAVPSKRRDRKRRISQVLETSQPDHNEDPVLATEEAEQKTAGGCDGEDKLSDECESTQETLNPVSQASNKNAHFLDAHSASYNSKNSGVAACDGALPSQHTTSTGGSPDALLQEKIPVRKEKGSKKKNSTVPPRTLASLVDTGNPSKQIKGEQQLSPQAAEQKSPVDESVCRISKGKVKAEAEETVTACCPSPKSDGQKETFKEGVTGPVHPRTRFEKQPVPVVPLFSTVIQNAVLGYPISVEVVDEIPGVRRKRAKSRNYELCSSPKPLWQTAKRTARQRTPRCDIPTYEDPVKVPGTGKAPKRSKEALSKKLLKRAVLTSKKIRTLASISEEKRRQPSAEVGLGFLSSELPPRWPVATSVPVSVALNRLRAVVCS